MARHLAAHGFTLTRWNRITIPTRYSEARRTACNICGHCDGDIYQICMNYLLLLFTALLSSCTHIQHYEALTIQSAPIELTQLVGIYKNQGYSPDGSRSELLSKILFPKRIDHSQLDTIQVIATQQSVICFGLSHGIQVVKQEYFQGKDFEIEGHKLTFGNQIGCFDCDATGAIHLGLSKKGKALYLSDNGDALMRFSEQGIGVILFMPIPLPVQEERDVLFEKID